MDGKRKLHSAMKVCGKSKLHCKTLVHVVIQFWLEPSVSAAIPLRLLWPLIKVIGFSTEALLVPYSIPVLWRRYGLINAIRNSTFCKYIGSSISAVFIFLHLSIFLPNVPDAPSRSNWKTPTVLKSGHWDKGVIFRTGHHLQSIQNYYTGMIKSKNNICLT